MSKIILGIGIVAALLAGFLSYSWMQRSARAQQQATETLPVVVAAQDLKWGTTITGDLVKVAPFLKRTLPDGYFPEASRVEGRTLVYPVKAGQPLFESQLAPRAADGGGISAVIAPQKRAMTVKVDKVIGVSGFIHPGNRVDVLATFNRTGADPTPATKTVLENVLVLATGSEIEKAGKAEKAAPVDVITLEVGVDEGEKLALAATEGKLQLALRNQADSASVATRGTTVSRLMSSVSPGADAAPVRARPAPRPMSIVQPRPHQVASSVEVVRGGAVSVMKFEKGEE
ncbi:MAG: Flp pilus assembly protein CpaB [Syntrophorhabdales bacterium]